MFDERASVFGEKCPQFPAVEQSIKREAKQILIKNHF